MNKYYLFPFYPLRRVVNYMPGDIVFDSLGYIYEVTEEFKLNKLNEHSVLNVGFTIDGCSGNLGLTKQQFKLFTSIVNNTILNPIAEAEEL
jgi:hypothetical protein